MRGVARHRGVAGVRGPGGHAHRRGGRADSSTTAGPCRWVSPPRREFGGLNVSITKLNGVCPQPVAPRPHGGWLVGRQRLGGGRRPGVDRLGRRRRRVHPHPRRLLRPAGHEGHLRPDLPGPARPSSVRAPSCSACLARSVRDAARYYDVCAGIDPRDPSSLPDPGNWEAGLGSHRPGRQAGGHPALPSPACASSPASRSACGHAAEELIAATGMVEVDITLELPNLAAQWAMGNLSTLLAELGDALAAVRRRPDRRGRPRLRPGRVALQPEPGRGGRGPAARGQRGHGRRPSTEVDFVICGHQPGPGLRRGRHHLEPDRDLPRPGQVQPRGAGPGFRAVMAACGWPTARSPGCPTR